MHLCGSSFDCLSWPVSQLFHEDTRCMYKAIFPLVQPPSQFTISWRLVCWGRVDVEACEPVLVVGVEQVTLSDSLPPHLIRPRSAPRQRFIIHRARYCIACVVSRTCYIGCLPPSFPFLKGLLRNFSKCCCKMMFRFSYKHWSRLLWTFF